MSEARYMQEKYSLEIEELEEELEFLKAEAERKMRMALQSKVIALNTQLAAEKGILLG